MPAVELNTMDKGPELMTIRRELAARVRARSAEIEQAIVARISAIAELEMDSEFLRDETTAEFILDAYLRPVESRKDGETLKRTLDSYLTANCNAASAAASLGIDRHTVQRRLGKIEESLGRSVGSCRAELEVALRVDALIA
jgi:DNA-binding PucR family transcriptional regulator